MNDAPPASDPRGPVTLRTAGETDEALFDALLQLYAYDFSALETRGSGWIDPGPDGRFNVHLRRVPVSNGAGSYLILWRGITAGFVTIDRRCPSGRGCDWNIGEFFVLRKYRRTGTGSAAVAAMVATRPGRWEAAVMPENLGALAFWRQTLAAYAASETTGVGHAEGRPVLRFRA